VSAIILLAVGVGLSSLAYPSAIITNFRTDTVITASTSTITYASTITQSVILPYSTSWYSTANVAEGCYGVPQCVQSSWGYVTLFTTSFSTYTTNPLLVSRSTQTLHQTISIELKAPLYTSLGLSTAEFVIVAILVIVVGGFTIFYILRGTIKPQQIKLSKLSPTERTPNNAFCVNCGAKLPKNSTFCNKCGEKQP
jgi:hypothetical protein